MNLEMISKSIQKNAGAWIFVFFICATAAGFLIQQYTELLAKKDAFEQQIKSFYELKAVQEQQLTAREKELYQHEISVKNKQEKYEIKLNELETLKKNYETLSAKLKENAQVLSIERQRQINGDTLRALMSEFSSMGVNLNRPPECSDKEGWKIYNSAKAKFSEAESFASANGLYDGYRGFFNTNTPVIISTCG